jgi:hypothetical protein
MRAGLIGAIVIAGALTACAPRVSIPVADQEQRPAGLSDAYYIDAAQRGMPVYAVDPALSLVVIEVRRAGTLAQLGHDHVVASHDARGYVAPAAGRADLYVRLDRLAVDERDLRAEAHFDSQPPEEAIAGTRENMLRKLDADAHPYAIIGVRGVDTDASGSWINATLALNGTERAMRIPAQIVLTTAELNVTGGVTVQQTSFGITPYSILAGALQVQDEVSIRFRIHARRLPM